MVGKRGGLAGSAVVLTAAVARRTGLQWLVTTTWPQLVCILVTMTPGSSHTLRRTHTCHSNRPSFCVLTSALLVLAAVEHRFSVQLSGNGICGYYR
jgi:hypothetical protein